MPTVFQKYKDQSGYSLLEVIMLCAVIALVAGIAMMSRGNSPEQFKRQNVAYGLKNALERARFDAVRRQAVQDASPNTCPSATDDTRPRVVISTSSYILVADADNDGDVVNDDGTFDNGDAAPTNIGTGIVLGGSGIDLPYTIFFNRRGEAVDVNGVSISPGINVCNVSCSAPGAANANLLLVTPTGTVNMLPGGSSPPTFGAPGITAINANTDVNEKVFVLGSAPLVCP